MIRKWHKRKRRRKFRTKWYKRTSKKILWIHHKTVIPFINSNWELLEKTLAEYSYLFNILVDVFHSAHTGQQSVYSDTPVGKIVYSKIIASGDQAIELDDIKNRLLFVWYNGVRRYYSAKQRIPFDNYIFRMSLWELKPWLNRHSSVVFERIEPSFETIELDDFPKIDLSFVVHGTKYPVLNKLSYFERYLLYLHFALEKTDIEIGKLTGLDAQTAKEKLYEIIERLKKGFTRWETMDLSPHKAVLH